MLASKLVVIVILALSVAVCSGVHKTESQTHQRVHSHLDQENSSLLEGGLDVAVPSSSEVLSEKTHDQRCDCSCAKASSSSKATPKNHKSGRKQEKLDVESTLDTLSTTKPKKVKAQPNSNSSPDRHPLEDVTADEGTAESDELSSLGATSQHRVKNHKSSKSDRREKREIKEKSKKSKKVSSKPEETKKSKRRDKNRK